MKKDINMKTNQTSTAMNGVKQTKSRPASEKDGVNGGNSLSDKSKLLRNGHAENEPHQMNGHSDNSHSGSDAVEVKSSEQAGVPSENGHREQEPMAKTRAKTARPNGLRKSGKMANGGGGGGGGGSGHTDPAKKQTTQQVVKPSGNKLEPLDQKGSAGTTPRSRGSDDSDSERKVSFRENPQDPANGSATSMPPSGEAGAPGRDRQNSLSKKRNGQSVSERERPWPATARDTVVNDLTRESPRHEGAVTWRKVPNGDAMMVPRIGSRDQDAWSENSSYGYGRCDQAYELTGRKFTRKAARANLGYVKNTGTMADSVLS